MCENIYPIPLIDGGFCLVDEIDYLEISALNWRRKHGYARQAGGTKDTILMHRLIMEKVINRKLLSSELIDHKNHNRCDNRRDNLRIATIHENSRNCKVGIANKTGFIGVHKKTKHNQYIGYITANGKTVYLGCFDDLQFGARVYDVAARDLHKEFASLNFPEENNIPEAVEHYQKMITYKGQRNSTSKYYGVCYIPKQSHKNPWAARVCIGKTTIYAKTFPTEEQAAKAVDKIVKENKLKKPINFPE
jgi:hypothetical protein